MFNADRCEGLPPDIAPPPEPIAENLILPQADALIRATGADIRVGGNRAFYVPSADYIQVIQGKDPTTNTYYDICATNALTTVGFTLMTVYPGTATSGVKSGANCNGPLAGIWRIEVRVSGSNPNLTLSVGVGLVL